jgi:2-polyprenyl-6-hydroxyphenyl methylase/3-demethylubiquinone-9 3-methyltransferase
VSPIDNELYDRLATSWWDEHGFLHALTALNPARFGYMRRILLDELHLVPSGLRILDVGCGGGLLAEEFARMGCAVTGVDPSGESLAAARRHAAEHGLTITYRQAGGEALPFDDGSFHAVYCCDVLEHVTSLERVIAETARVLQPGGIYLFDTINRTLQSWILVIGLLQEWKATSLMPPHLHQWRMFVRPTELRALLERHGLAPSDFIGLTPRAGLLRVLGALRARKRGRLSYTEAVAAMDIGESGDTSVQYLGYATKRVDGRSAV